MFHLTRPGKIDIDSKYSGAGMVKVSLYNFDIDGDSVKHEHRVFIMDRVVPLLQDDRGHIWMQGSASKAGTNAPNRFI